AERGAFTLAICTPSLMISTVPLLRKCNPPVFEPAVSTTSWARCFTTGKPASFLSSVAKSGINEGMGRSFSAANSHGGYYICRVRDHSATGGLNGPEWPMLGGAHDRA